MAEMIVASRCLFCLKTDGPFERPEHIIPESTCNEDVVLPPGIVCDPCNQYFGEKVDAHFVHHHHGVFQKLIHVTETKKGKPPTMPLQDGSAGRNKDGTFSMREAVIEGKEAEQVSMVCGANQITLNASFYPEPGDARLMSRFIAKAGMEILYLKSGDIAFEERFNVIRNYARYGSPSFFIPFAWTRGNWAKAEVRRVALEWKINKHLDRLLASFTVPGAAYVIQLESFEETWPLETVAAKLGCSIVDKPGLIEAEPIRVKLQWGNDEPTQEKPESVGDNLVSEKQLFD